MLSEPLLKFEDEPFKDEPHVELSIICMTRKLFYTVVTTCMIVCVWSYLLPTKEMATCCISYTDGVQGVLFEDTYGRIVFQVMPMDMALVTSMSFSFHATGNPKSITYVGFSMSSEEYVYTKCISNGAWNFETSSTVNTNVVWDPFFVDVSLTDEEPLNVYVQDDECQSNFEKFLRVESKPTYEMWKLEYPITND